MPRPDANQIALKAARAILEAAHSFSFKLAGTSVAVEVERLPQPSWPRPIADLDPSRDGDWPAPVKVLCSIDSLQLELLLKARLYTYGSRYKDHVSLGVYSSQPNKELLWINLANRLDEATEARPGIAQANSALIGKEDGEDVRAITRAMNVLVKEAGLPFLSRTQVDAFRMTVPDGAVLPDAGTGFERLILLAVIKYPFMTRGEPEALRFLDIGPLLSKAAQDVEPEKTLSTEKYGGVQPLPGGAHSYLWTLRGLLRWIGEAQRTTADFDAHLRTDYGQSGDSAIRAYRRLLNQLDLVDESGADISLTEAGVELLGKFNRQANSVTPTAGAPGVPPATPPYAPLSQHDCQEFFDRFDARFSGMLELIVGADLAGILTAPMALDLLKVLLEVQWSSPNQAVYRLNWLSCLGLLAQKGTTFSLTEVGRAALERHAERATGIRASLEALPDFAPQPDPVEELDQDDEGGLDDQEGPGDGRPALWDEDSLNLHWEQVQSELGSLRLPQRLLQQACAALRAGKHLLLIGPPGTGKTELAMVLGRTAHRAGYCQGVFTATASADWSTFDVLGGYTLQKDSQLQFRPGVFLRALEDFRWLLIDELNRADIDKAFGELMTLLAGGSVDTHFLGLDERPIAIGRDPKRYSHVMPGAFRVIGTMNTWDKTSLFRLSYAVQRRFAVLHVDVPDDSLYRLLLEDEAQRESALRKPLDEAPLRKLQQLFSSSGLLPHRPVGPAVARDIVRYMRERDAAGDGASEAIELFLLPQLEGLSQVAALQVWRLLHELLEGWASNASLLTLRGYFQELFPHLKLEIL